jgi:hypothetical protein
MADDLPRLRRDKCGTLTRPRRAAVVAALIAALLGLLSLVAFAVLRRWQEGSYLDETMAALRS